MSENAPGMWNRFVGDAHSVLQARDVHGGIHIHEVPRPDVKPPHHVLPPPRHYTNNQRQLDELTAILACRNDDGPRVALIRGAPGSGRTTLATTWVYQFRSDYPDGQILVRLAAGDDGADREREALGYILAEVGFDHDVIPASLDGRVAWWRSWSAGRRVAVVVDDALLPRQVEALLPGSGPSVVLAVEAGRLSALRARVSAEEVTIDPLSTESARLLLSRMVGSERTAAEPGPVLELIGLCEGSATALCVVGAMLAEFPERPIARLAAKLVRDERVLTELSRDEDLSLSVVFDAAYDRLLPLAQRCYRLLGVHPGSSDVALDTVAAVLDEPVSDVEHAMHALLRAMLVQETAPGRYLMSGLIREHAPSSSEQGSGTSRRDIVDYYRWRALVCAMAWAPERGWLQEIWPDLVVDTGGLDKSAARAWMMSERVNLRNVVETAYSQGELEWVCQLGIALWPLHEEGKYTADLAATNRLGVDAARSLGKGLAAAVLGLQWGYAHRQRAEFDHAVDVFMTAREDAARAGSLTAEASAVESLGLIRLDQNRLGEAVALFEENLRLAERIGAPRRLALARFHLAKALASPAAALRLLDQARADLLASGQDEDYNLMKITLWRGKRLLDDGRVEEAADVVSDAAVAAEVGRWHHERAQVCEVLADLALARDEPSAALSHLGDALDIYRVRGFVAQAVGVEARLAELAGRQS